MPHTRAVGRRSDAIMRRGTLLSLRLALCGLLALTDHKASRDLALLGICMADILLSPGAA